MVALVILDSSIRDISSYVLIARPVAVLHGTSPVRLAMSQVATLLLALAGMAWSGTLGPGPPGS